MRNSTLPAAKRSPKKARLTLNTLNHNNAHNKHGLIFSASFTLTKRCSDSALENTFKKFGRQTNLFPGGLSTHLRPFPPLFRSLSLLQDVDFSFASTCKGQLRPPRLRQNGPRSLLLPVPPSPIAEYSDPHLL